MQYLVVYASNPALPRDGQFSANGVGLKVSHKYGFGVLDGAAIVNRARWWIPVPPQKNCSIDVDLSEIGYESVCPRVYTLGSHMYIVPISCLMINLLLTHIYTHIHAYYSHAKSSQPLEINIDSSSCTITYLEHVQAITTLSLPNGRRKDVEISLVSPMGHTSVLLPHRRNDYSSEGFHDWPFMTVHNWGEDPRGHWKYVVKVSTAAAQASLDKLTLKLFGTEETPRSVRNVPSQCHEECEGGCAGEGAQYCDTCKNFQLETTFECVASCPDSTYVDHHMCRSCPPFCTRCNQDRCITCADGAVRLSDGACAQSCEPFSFLAPNRSCVLCHHSCVECSGSGAHDCTVCPQQFALVNGSCSAPLSCQSGKYFDGRSLECRLCHKSCAECTGKGVQECSACFEGFVLQDGVCEISNTSSTQCSSNQFFDSSRNVCVPCSPNCVKCTDDITCVSCDSDHYLWTERVGESQEEVTTCVAECPRGFHGDSTSLSCQSCPSYCKTCDSHDKCTLCTLDFAEPLNGQCPQPCHDGQFFDFQTSHCLQCLSKCQTCQNAKSCLACKEGYFLVSDDECVSVCPEHLMKDPETHACVSESCHKSCESCFGPEPDQCLTCPNGSKLFEHSCMEVCPPHTYYKELTASCLHCHDSCLSCAGPSEQNCLQCPEDKLLSHFMCVTECPKDSFALNNECVSCPANCEQCVSAQTCSACREPYLLQKGQCVEVCGEGFTAEGSVCQPCPSGCKECQPNLCTSCSEGFLYYEPDHSCMQSCPTGYYASGGTCHMCPANCSECSGPGQMQCLLCSQGSAMDTSTHTCIPCCSKDFPDRTPCCDCTTHDDTTCITGTLTDTSAVNKTRKPSFALVVIILGVFAVLVTVLGIGTYYAVTRLKKGNPYKRLPNSNLGNLPATLALIEEDSESGSEAELFAKMEP